MNEKMQNFDAKDLMVGDVFYGVKDTTNAYHRKKIYREIDGESWFKYDIPLASYSLVTFNVIGVLEKNLTGQWEPNSEYELESEIYVTTTEGDGKATLSYTMFVSEVDSNKYFLDKGEAMAYIDLMYAKDGESDRQ
jgi:hypothetical protein